MQIPPEAYFLLILFLSELDNPYLGSLGFAIVELTKPPVKAEHVTSFYSFEKTRSAVMMGGTKGVAGLAQVGGGLDHITEKSDMFYNWRCDDFLHSFVGYVPINLMSTTESIRVVK